MVRRFWVVCRALLAALAVLAPPASAAAESRLPAYRTLVPDGSGNDIALYAEETGEGRPVVLVHGLGASTFTWRHIAPELARGNRVIAIDLKGFGRSDKPFDGDYSPQAHAALVAAFIRKRGLNGITLVGHSLGGTVAALVALDLKDEPGRLRSLVLIAAPVLPDSIPRHYDAILVPGAPEALIAPLPPDAIARLMLNGARGGSRGITDADVAGYAAPYYELSAKRAFVASARAVVHGNGAGMEQRLRTLSKPSLLVWCRGDEVVPLAAGRRLARVMPNATFKVLSRCHHLPQDERPSALLGVLRPFLAR